MTRQATLRFVTRNQGETTRAALKRALGRSKDSRAIIALKLSELTGQTITEHMLNKWCAPSKDNWRFPLELAEPLCTVLDDFMFIDDLLRPGGRRLATEDEERLSKLGKLHEEKNRIDAEIARLGG